MKNVGSGPADKFAQAISRGDFKEALQELDKLKQQLADGLLGEEQKEELADQLDEMARKLEGMCEAHRAARKNLQDRIARARQAGRRVAGHCGVDRELDPLWLCHHSPWWQPADPATTRIWRRKATASRW